ncbi:hypothetical protein FJTKL_15555 [Diaporthe vaccinii]|uniref:Polarity defective-2 n=1 Tax=Diaporthe vaccinii TaxID=105482 RepID=A0ABR4F6X5_9PEZI
MMLYRNKMVANFKTEESQRRLLTSVIAAHPELKLNFKAICEHYGPEDWGKDGIEHFFRPLKKDAADVRKMVKNGQPAKSYFDSKAGKGGAAVTASSAPVTPKAGRKRAATSAPSTGRSTASKKARGSVAKAVQPTNVINLDDEDDDNEFPPIPLDTPMKGPRFTENYAAQFYGTDTQAPALDTTQADTPNEDEDFKPHTPTDAAAFSFSQAPFYSGGGGSGGGGGGYNLDTDPIAQPSFAATSGYSKTWTNGDEYDDEV